ncbi:helix-turn-helix domain-containing protein [Marinibactrum halimedae]|uniref:Transcriptional regulator n=1 Tax=Marinibactrum halimedae TaxID=1444977 RepID=A0AA37WM49_9GAMM|nr:helix-turn-helix transcriptional regulator [Marinibactrum halimedae]MCD9461116.1 helix-turn-helix domain-containing protein [Marinibactrum halimedae]GLS24456.1 transcriptional regulator [Marinibactrum halimedae]
MPTPKDAPIERPVFGKLLKFWRGVHRLSQEELALELDASTRHISFLENGKASPSKAMVEAIADVMSMGQRDRSHLMIAAGFTPDTQAVDFYAPDYKWLRKAMSLSLNAQDPNPSALMDSCGNLLMVNRGWVAFFQDMLGETDLLAVKNYYDLIFRYLFGQHDMTGWENAPSLILMSLQQEAIFNGDVQLQKAIERFALYPCVPKNWQQIASKVEPMTSFRIPIEINGQLESFFTVTHNIGSLGPAAFLSEPRLVMITLYPEHKTSHNRISKPTTPIEHPLLTEPPQSASG